MATTDRLSTSTRARSALVGLTAGWPWVARLLWWVGKPACTVAALVAAVVHGVSGAGWVAAGVAAALAIGARTLRRPWLVLPAAVLAGLLVPVVGLALIGRAAIGAVAVLLAGRSWRGGMAVVTRGRRHVLDDVPTVDESHERLRSLADMSEDDAYETMGMAVVAAWAGGDGLRTAATAGTLLRLAVLGHAGPSRLPFDLDFMRLAVLEELLEFARRTLCAGLAICLLVIAWSGRLDIAPAFVIDGGWIRTTIAYVLTFLLAYHVLRRAERSPTFLVLLTVGVLVTAGWASLAVVACIAVAAGVGNALKPVITALLLGGSGDGDMGPAPRPGSRRGRETWRAAAEARRWKSDYEVDLWTEIVADPHESSALRASAVAALAEIALDSSRLQDAVRHADESLALLSQEKDPSGPLRARVQAAAGRAFLAAGDRARARELLGPAAAGRALRNDRVVQGAWQEASGVASSGAGLVTKLASQRRSAAQAGDAEALRDLLRTDFDDTDLDDVQTRHALRREQSRGHLDLGNLELRSGNTDAATRSLRRAITDLGDPSAAIELATARTLLGAATATTSPDRAFAELAAGVRALEESRGTLANGLHRSGLILRHAGVYEQFFAAARSLQDRGQDAGRLAAEVVESLRRGSLATMLRAGSLELGAALQSLQARVAELEDQDGPTLGASLSAARQAMATELSSLFASAYVPEPVRISTPAIGDRHVLSYHLDEVRTDLVRGHLVWAAPGGRPVIVAFSIDDPALLVLVGAPGGAEVRLEHMAAPQDAAAAASWVGLGAALLPDGLRLLLTGLPDGGFERILVVPHGPLAALPWAALRIDDGRPLVLVAELQIVPSLALLVEEHRAPRSMGYRKVAVHLADPASRSEARVLRQLPVEWAEDKEAFLTLLASDPPGAYIAAHGEHVGLGQAVTFRHGGQLSAAAALGRRWPRWVVFASCLVGRVDFELGTEPLGLPISCMLGGADTIVGGVIEVGYTAGAQAARVAVRVSRGEHPAAALRAEQVEQFRRGAGVPLTAWASLICLSRLGPSPRHD